MALPAAASSPHHPAAHLLHAFLEAASTQEPMLLLTWLSNESQQQALDMPVMTVEHIAALMHLHEKFAAQPAHL